jgi:hypothetical protein
METANKINHDPLNESLLEDLMNFRVTFVSNLHHYELKYYSYFSFN